MLKFQLLLVALIGPVIANAWSIKKFLHDWFSPIVAAKVDYMVVAQVDALNNQILLVSQTNLVSLDNFEYDPSKAPPQAQVYWHMNDKNQIISIDRSDDLCLTKCEKDQAKVSLSCLSYGFDGVSKCNANPSSDSTQIIPTKEINKYISLVPNFALNLKEIDFYAMRPFQIVMPAYGMCVGKKMSKKTLHWDQCSIFWKPEQYFLFSPEGKLLTMSNGNEIALGRGFHPFGDSDELEFGKLQHAIEWEVTANHFIDKKSGACLAYYRGIYFSDSFFHLRECDYEKGQNFDVKFIRPHFI